MRLLLFTCFLLLTSSGFSQLPKSGTYIYQYCDLEYNKCLGKCKVVIKKDSIIIYATKELSQRITIEENKILNEGIIVKHTSGKWIIGKTKDDANAREIGVEGPAIIDFKKKQYWTF